MVDMKAIQVILSNASGVGYHVSTKLNMTLMVRLSPFFRS